MRYACKCKQRGMREFRRLLSYSISYFYIIPMQTPTKSYIDIVVDENNTLCYISCISNSTENVWDIDRKVPYRVYHVDERDKDNGITRISLSLHIPPSP